MRNVRLGVACAVMGLVCVAAGQKATELKADPKASEASEAAGISVLQNAGTAKVSTLTERPKPVLEREDVITLAEWNGGKLTNEQVSATLATRRPAAMREVTPQVFDKLERNAQVDVVKQLALEQILLGKARAEGISEETATVASAIRPQEEALLNRIYYQEKIGPELTRLTEDAAKEFYESHKSEMFTEPATTLIRALHVSTYEMVTAEEGDTLKGIAEKVSGDSDAAQRIRESAPPYYMRQTAPELDDKVLSTPLKAGEVLYVPLGKAQVTSATALAESLRAKLQAGEPLDKVVDGIKDSDFAVSATLPLKLTDDAGFYPEIVRAADALKGTSVSEVIKTPTGLNILYVEDRSTTRVVPFGDVKAKLIERVTTEEDQRRQTVEKTRKQVLDTLWQKYGVEVNRAAIERSNYLGADPLSTDTMIAKVDDLVYTLEDYLSDMRMTGKDWGQLSQDERNMLVKVAPKLINYVIAKHATELGYKSRGDYKEGMKGIAQAQIVAEYRRRHDDPEDRHVTLAELEAYYKDNIDKYTSPAQVTLREISKRINMAQSPDARAESIEKAKQSLKEIRGRITSEDEFAQLARRESEAISTRSRGGLLGTVSETFRGEAFKNQIRQLKPGEVSEPFLYGSEVMIVRIDDRTAPTVQPLEQVRNRVMRDYAATEPGKLKKQKIESELKEAGFKITF